MVGELELVSVAVRNLKKKRDISIPDSILTTNPTEIINNPNRRLPTEQRKIFANHAKEITEKDVSLICSANVEKKTILMCGNRDFHGFQKLILDKLIK